MSDLNSTSNRLHSFSIESQSVFNSHCRWRCSNSNGRWTRSNGRATAWSRRRPRPSQGWSPENCLWIDLSFFKVNSRDHYELKLPTIASEQRTLNFPHYILIRATSLLQRCYVHIRRTNITNNNNDVVCLIACLCSKQHCFSCYKFYFWYNQACVNVKKTLLLM